MKRIISVIFVYLFVIFFNIVSAQDEDYETWTIRVKESDVQCRITSMEEIVTANRTATPRKLVASSYTVITSGEIEDKKETNVVEVLKNIPGITIAQTGSFGGNASLFIRGANTEHTLIMIDGIEMNDPISMGRSYNMSNLTLENIEKIEIIRGPQSPIYGSDAIGGVINIITKKGTGKKNVLNAAAGSFKTFRESFGIEDAIGKFRYSFGISRIDTEGISSAGEQYGNTEKDGYRNTSGSLKFGFTSGDGINTDLVLKYIDAVQDLDNGGGQGKDDVNYTGKTKEFYAGLKSSIPALVKDGEQNINISFSRHNRTYKNEKDPANPDDFLDDFYSSQIRKIDWQHNMLFASKNNFLIGLEYEEERGKSTSYSESSWGPFTSDFSLKTSGNKAVYLQNQDVFNDKYFVNFGTRFDSRDKFGSKLTYRIAPGVVLDSKGSKLKASYATGFKSPSLYQLYSSYGDENLNPEKTKGWDAGIEQNFLDERIFFDLVYFSNDFSDLIDYDLAASKYKNISEAETKGLELNCMLKLVNNLTVNINGMHLDAKNLVKDENLLRRPKYKYGIGAAYNFNKNGILNVNYSYTGKRDDRDTSVFPAQKVVLDSFELLNVSVSYLIIGNFEMFAKADNIFDRKYEEAKGYGTPGSSFYGGIKINY
ncbi:MAG: TonB-dependent receptor [bacterium]